MQDPTTLQESQQMCDMEALPQQTDPAFINLPLKVITYIPHLEICTQREH